MRKLTSIVLALAISGGLVFANFAYKTPTLDAANTQQISVELAALNIEDASSVRKPADDLLVAQLNEKAELKLQSMTREIEANISSQFASHLE